MEGSNSQQVTSPQKGHFASPSCVSPLDAYLRALTGDWFSQNIFLNLCTKFLVLFFLRSEVRIQILAAMKQELSPEWREVGNDVLELYWSLMPAEVLSFTFCALSDYSSICCCFAIVFLFVYFQLPGLLFWDQIAFLQPETVSWPRFVCAPHYIHNITEIQPSTGESALSAI